MSKDPVTALKELADRAVLPAATFDTDRAGGTEHEPGWTATVTLSDGTLATGVGHSKSEAKRSAAGALLQKVNSRTR